MGATLKTQRGNYKHGLRHHPLYRIWEGMKRRCNCIKDSAYKNYGGRGITVCKEWVDNPDIFYSWAMNHGYQAGLELNRINNNGDYEPGNCEFTTTQNNCNNRRSNIVINYQNTTYTLAQLVRQIGVVSYSIARRRITKWHWDPIEAITKPKLKPCGRFKND